MDSSYTTIDLSYLTPHFKNTIILHVIDGNSSFYHAIFLAYYTPYQLQKKDGRYVNRRKFVNSFRHELANLLDHPATNVNNTDSITHYQTLDRGKLNNPEHTIEAIRKAIRFNHYINPIVHQYISNIINKDIYIIDFKTKEVVQVTQNKDLIYQQRDSIIVIYFPGHYELIGIYIDNKITTLFSPHSELITTIRNHSEKNTLQRET